MLQTPIIQSHGADNRKLYEELKADTMLGMPLDYTNSQYSFTINFTIIQRGLEKCPVENDGNDIWMVQKHRKAWKPASTGSKQG